MRIMTSFFALGLAIGATTTVNANQLLLQAPSIERSASMSFAAGEGGTGDTYCSDTSSRYALCDAKFVKKCEDGGGHMSLLQGWGGKTCWQPGP